MQENKNVAFPSGSPKSPLKSYRPEGRVRARIGAVVVNTLLLIGITGRPARAQDTPSGSDAALLSRITVAVPLFTRHYPDDRRFNDGNWGGLLFYSLDDHLSLAGGDFINSYRRNTAFAGLSVVPWSISISGLKIDPGLIAAFDLNQGYKGYNRLDPLLGAVTIKVGGNYFDDPDYQFLNRIGVLTTVIPTFGNGTSTALNLALTARL